MFLKITRCYASVVALHAFERFFFSRMTLHVSCEVIAIYAGVSELRATGILSPERVCM